jgi:hypothetical protein
MKTYTVTLVFLFLFTLIFSEHTKEFIVCDMCDGKGFIIKHSTNSIPKNIICPECGNKTHCGPETNFKNLSGWWKEISYGN